MDFGGLAVGVSRGDAFAEGLEASHFGLGAAAGVVSRPPLPERPAVVARGARVSFRAVAAGQSSFHGRPFLRIGMIAVPPSAMMALWQRRVSLAPSAVTVPMSSSGVIWPSRSGRTGLSPSRLRVNSPRGCPRWRCPSPDGPCAIGVAPRRHACGPATPRRRGT